MAKAIYVDSNGVLSTISALDASSAAVSGAVSVGSLTIGGINAATEQYFQEHLAGLDIQSDVDETQSSSTTPGTTEGYRYLVGDIANMHANFGLSGGQLKNVAGTLTTVANNDIIEYRASWPDGGTNEWRISYDVSAEGAGALFWSKTSSDFQYWNGTTWSEFGGLSGVTAGAGLTKTGNQIDIVSANSAITVNADNIELTLASGSGLEISSGLKIDLDTDSGLQLGTGGLSVASSIAGDGLAYNAGVLSVNVTGGIEISADTLQLASTVAGDGLTLSTGVLSVVVDGTTIEISTDALGIKDGGVTEAKLHDDVIKRAAELVLDDSATTPTASASKGAIIATTANSQNEGKVEPLVTPGMAIRVQVGGIAYNHQGKRISFSSAANVAVTAADGSQNRYDIVVINSSGSIVIREGALSAGTPSDPTLTAGDIPLARLNISAGLTAVDSGEISDLREITGLVHGSKLIDASITGDKFASSVAGDGLTIQTDALAVNVDDTTLAISGDQVKIKDSGVGPTQLAGTAVDGVTISGGGGSALALIDGSVGASKLRLDSYVTYSEAGASNVNRENVPVYVSASGEVSMADQAAAGSARVTGLIANSGTISNGGSINLHTVDGVYISSIAATSIADTSNQTGNGSFTVNMPVYAWKNSGYTYLTTDTSLFSSGEYMGQVGNSITTTALVTKFGSVVQKS